MVKMLIKLTYVLACVLLFSSCGKDEDEVMGSIYGKITDSQTNMTLGGAHVSLAPGGLSATTGSDGTFEFNNLAPGQYEIKVKKDDYFDNNKKISVIAGQKASGDLMLTPVTQNAKVELSVSTLNFGKQISSLSFDIQNKGNTKFNWNISGLSDIKWLEFSPSSGTVEGGKSNAVKVTVLRDKLKQNEETTVIINADKESVSLKILAEQETNKSKIELSTKTLNFGTEYTTLSFNILNVGNAGVANWRITDVDANWVTVSPSSGSTDMGKSSAVKVTIDRTKIESTVCTNIIVNADGESYPVVINADAQPVPERSWMVYPTNIDLGTDKTSESFIIYSYNGPTSYQLYTRGEAEWLTFTKTEGTIPQYKEGDLETIEYIQMIADRTNLTPGIHTCTVIARSDLGDLEIPVSITVETSNNPGGDEPDNPDVAPTIISCDSRIDFKLKSCRRSGTMVIIDYSITNKGDDISNFDLIAYNNLYFDNVGNQYNANSGYYELGTEKKNGGYRLRVPIPNGVTVNGLIKLPNVSTDATEFTNVTLACQNYSSSWRLDNDKIVIRNLKISN